METEGRSTAPPSWGGEAADEVIGARPVRVSYQPRRFGVVLVVEDEAGGGAEGAGGAAGTGTGLLRVSDAVITLEIPLPDGTRSVLSWDPAEVVVDPLAAP